MLFLQVLINGLLLGGLYACIAAGFSLVWGVVNIINLLHGSLIILGAYGSFYAYRELAMPPLISAPVVGAALFCVGYGVQRFVVNRVIGATVLVTLTLTFGLNLVLDNVLLLAFKADYRKLNLAHPFGLIELRDYFDANWLDVVIPVDRLVAASVAVVTVAALYVLLRSTNIGRAVVAVRMDRRAAQLMGVDVEKTYALTFGLGAALAGIAGALLSVIFPISPLTSPTLLSKSFVICIIGGLGSMPGVLAGGIVLGLTESFGASLFGSEHSLTISFALLLLLLIVRPTGLFGKKAFQ
jgi:branched-chain amino acid transport system permease protein